MLAGRASPLSLSDLAPGGVYLATPVSRGTGALLPHRFTLTASRGRGGLLSVARAVALRAQRLAGTLPYGARTFLGGVRPRDRMVRPAKVNRSTRRGSATSRSPSSCGRDPTGPRPPQRRFSVSSLVRLNDDVAVHDGLPDAGELVDHALRDERLVVLVQRP